MEGFSIREFASRMRSVNVVKCWPFEEVDEEYVKAMLPPITVKKFKWWFDDLEMVRSSHEETSRRRRKKKEKLQDKIMLISDLEMERVRKVKPKAKAPKKRSIVELFAVAPQVERVNSDDDYDDEEIDEDEVKDSDKGSNQEDGFRPNSKLLGFPNLGFNCKSKRKKVKNKGLARMLEKQKEMIKNLKQKEMIKNLKQKVNNNKEEEKEKKKKKKGEDMSVNKKTAKEEKSSKLPNPNGSSHSKGIFIAVSTQMKKPRLKSVAAEKKSKTKRNPKFLANHRQSVVPVRGILRDQGQLFLIENCISEDASKVNQHDTQLVKKHVTFSLKDDLHCQGRKRHPTTELESRNFNNSISGVTGSSLVKRHSAERGKSLSIQDMKEAEKEISGCKGNEIDVQPISTMQFSIRCHSTDSSNFLVQHGCQENLFDRAVSIGQSTLHNQTFGRFEGRSRGNDALHTCTSAIPSMSGGENISKLTVPMFAKYSSDASTSSQRFRDLSGDPDSQFATGYSMDRVKAYPQTPYCYASTLNENAELRCLLPLPTTRDNVKDHTLPYQWLPHLSPRELMHTICSLPDWKSRMAMFGETSTNEDFVGLPLSSQGELIRLNSDDNGGFNQFGGTSTGPSLAPAMHKNVLAGLMVDQTYFRRSDCITSFTDQPNKLMFKDSGKEIESCHMPSRLGTLGHCGNRTNIMTRGMDPCFYSLESAMDQMKVSQNASRQDDQVHRHPRNEMIQQHENPSHIALRFSQSTMRLMGQEFKIGGRAFQGLEDREVWTDKQIIMEQHANTAIGGFLESQNLPESVEPPIIGKLKDNITHFSEANIGPAARNVSLMMVPDSKFLYHVLDGQNNVTHQNSYEISKGNLMPEIYPHFPVAGSPLWDSPNSLLQESFLSECRPPKISQMLAPSSVYDSGQNLSRSCIQLQEQTPGHATKLAFKFPFSDSECVRDIQPSRCQSSFKVMPAWLLEARQKGTLIDFCQAYSGPGSSYCPWSISDSNYQTDPSLYQAPDPFNLFPRSALPNPFASATLPHRPLVPVHPGFLPDSALQTSYGEKMMFKNRVNSSFRAMIPNHGGRTKKRLASASDDSVRPIKMPKFGILEGLNQCVTGVETSPTFECDVQCSGQALESAISKDKADTIECDKNGAPKDEIRVFRGIDSFNLQDGAAKSGPIKLTAGARYVLKPCQKKDETNSKATQSPFASTTAAGRVLTSENPAKLYRF